MFSSGSFFKFLLEDELLLFSSITDAFGGRGGAFFFSISFDGLSNETIFFSVVLEIINFIIKSFSSLN